MLHRPARVGVAVLQVVHSCLQRLDFIWGRRVIFAVENIIILVMGETSGNLLVCLSIQDQRNGHLPLRLCSVGRGACGQQDAARRPREQAGGPRCGGRGVPLGKSARCLVGGPLLPAGVAFHRSSLQRLLGLAQRRKHVLLTEQVLDGGLI